MWLLAGGLVLFFETVFPDDGLINQKLALEANSAPALAPRPAYQTEGVPASPLSSPWSPHWDLWRERSAPRPLRKDSKHSSHVSVEGRLRETEDSVEKLISLWVVDSDYECHPERDREPWPLAQVFDGDALQS